jgi:DNA-directed RNA polymerase specialized sigma24 family protein
MALPVSDIDVTPRATEAGPAHGEDFASLQSVATGDGAAQRLLAQRLVARVRRAAATFMPGSPDADDAAYHALIEALRSTHSYEGDVSLETWADALVSRSLVRFARAVRRKGHATSMFSLDETTGEPPRASASGDGLVGFDAHLARLSDVRREAVVLHHVYGFPLERSADIAQCTLAVARERLLLGRQDLCALALEAKRERAAEHKARLESWGALRDREAVGEVLTDEELDECAVIERNDPVVHASAEQVRELEHALNRATLLSATDEDRTLVERVLRAARVSTTGSKRSRDEADAELDHSVDPEGPLWLRGGATTITALLSAAVVIALLMYEPKPQQVAAKAEVTRPLTRPSPQVVSLVDARTSARGNQLTRAGVLLAPATMLREGDVLRAEGNPACIAIDPDAELCLNRSAQLKLASLSLATRSVELLDGHVVLKRSPAPEQPLLIEAGDVRAVADGAVFGVEREADGDVRVRVLEGEALVRGDGWSSKVSANQLGVYRKARGTFDVESLPNGQMMREWELHATGQRGAGIAASLDNTQPAGAQEGGEPQQTAESAKSADELMMQGAEHARAERWAEAVDAYEAVLRQHRGTPEAHIVLVRLGELRLERRKEPERALVAFERYLQEGAGPLEAEALYGTISALLQLKREDAAREKAQLFVTKFPKDPHATVLRPLLTEEEPSE